MDNISIRNPAWIIFCMCLSGLDSGRIDIPEREVLDPTMAIAATNTGWSCTHGDVIGSKATYDSRVSPKPSHSVDLGKHAVTW